MGLGGVLGVLSLLDELSVLDDMDDYLDWEAICLLDMAANVSAQLAVQEAAMQMEEERGRRRNRGNTVTKQQMQATREASVLLGHNINNYSNHKRHQRSMSVMSDYFDAIGEDGHIENDEHEYEYASIFSTLANAKRNSSIGKAMREWHARTSSVSSSSLPSTQSLDLNQQLADISTASPLKHITFTSASPATEKSELGTAMQQWHARTRPNNRLKRRGTGRGMDIMAQTLDWGEWEGLLGKALGSVVEGWEESVLAFVLLVVMFRLWLLDAFGGRI